MADKTLPFAAFVIIGLALLFAFSAIEIDAAEIENIDLAAAHILFPLTVAVLFFVAGAIVVITGKWKSATGVTG